MSDRPILFSAPMVRALLDGRKIQTRRLLKPKKHACLISDGWTDAYVLDIGNREWLETYYHWRVGDRLYVRESFSFDHRWIGTKPSAVPIGESVWYWADGDLERGDWTKPISSIYMPRWVSRLTLAVTDVRVERIQDIRHAGAKAEGVLPFAPHRAPQGGSCDGDSSGFDDCARCAFKLLWAQINDPRTWFSNSWVVVVTFRAEHRNIDALLMLPSQGARSVAAIGDGCGSPSSGA